MPDYSLETAYNHCLAMARNHYENFPVASRLLPRRLRRPVAAIYAFARCADDMADEGELPPQERLALLDDFGVKLDAIGRGESAADPVFIALADVRQEHRLPLGLFHDLLTAFRQDVSKKRYAEFAEVLDYCRHSANPVGRLLLHLHGTATEENLVLSDHICTALQLINFLQDITQDYEENGRIYLPQDEMVHFGVTEFQIHERRNDDRMHALIHQQIQRTRTMMFDGAPLGRRIGGRFGLELRLITQGGLRVLERLETNLSDVFTRPRLGKGDWLRIVFRALFT